MINLSTFTYICSGIAIILSVSAMIINIATFAKLRKYHRVITTTIDYASYYPKADPCLRRTFKVGDKVWLWDDWSVIGGPNYEQTHPAKGEHGVVVEDRSYMGGTYRQTLCQYYAVSFPRFPDEPTTYEAGDLRLVE